MCHHRAPRAGALDKGIGDPEKNTQEPRVELGGRKLAVYEALVEVDGELASINVGSVLVSQSSNPDRIALASPGSRELLDRLPIASEVRAFPKTDPIFAKLQEPPRASAESANRTIDDSHPRERLHHYGFHKSHLSMLAWQTYRNAQTESVFAPEESGSSGVDPVLNRSPDSTRPEATWRSPHPTP